MKVYLDDERETPEGWFRVYTAAEAILTLAAGGVTEISLDHDLGQIGWNEEQEDPENTGYTVAKWIEQAAFEGRLPRTIVHLHTANPVGLLRMHAAICNANRYWDERGS